MNKGERTKQQPPGLPRASNANEGVEAMDHTDHESPKGEENADLAQEDTTLIDEDPAGLARTEVRLGKFPGQERVRIIRPSHTSLRRVRTGLLKATAETQTPRSPTGRAFYYIKRFLIGAPLTSAEVEEERLTKFKALAILSSDAISSVAYATEAILVSLIAAGSGHLGTALPISFAIVILLSIVTLSYRQTIPAYPQGGGAYVVAKENLGTLAGLIAAASLLIDYILTVSVSVSAGVQNLAALFSGLTPYIVEIDVALVVLITLVNLRGIRESGSIFAIPTYFFIVSAFLLIIVGLVKAFVFQHQPLIGQFRPVAAIEPLTVFLLLKSFAAGCSAMTGVEAISTAVPVFKKPETRNAAITLAWMAVILGTLFLGITALAMTYSVGAPGEGNPVIAQLASRVFTGPLVFMYPVFQIATLLILTLAANTSYSGFPRLASFLALDDFAPHQLAFRGDRLNFSIGVIVLAVIASLLLIVFRGNTTQLINLYAVGVFMSFTLSQGGMVVHWWRLRKEQRGWQRSLAINGVGSVTTLIVTLIIAVTKFLEGAWIVVVLIPLMVLVFIAIHRHYSHVERERTTTIPASPADIKHLFMVPIAGLDRAAIQSLAYARSISKHVIVVHIAFDTEDATSIRAAWKQWKTNIAQDEKTELVVIESPYRSLTRPLLDYIDTVHELYRDYVLTVLLPEFVVAHWWEYPLHNQTALQLKIALFFRPDIIVTNVPQHLPG